VLTDLIEISLSEPYERGGQALFLLRPAVPLNGMVENVVSLLRLVASSILRMPNTHTPVCTARVKV
jgi:hypothetical protein